MALPIKWPLHFFLLVMNLSFGINGLKSTSPSFTGLILLVLALLFHIDEELIAGLNFGNCILMPLRHTPDVLLFNNLPIVTIRNAEPICHEKSPLRSLNEEESLLSL